MSSNKHQTITTHEPSVMPPSRHASSPDVGIDSSPQIPPPESKTGITLEAGTKPSIPSPAQGPTINTTPRCTFLQSPDQQQPLQALQVFPCSCPAAEERLRSIQQVSHGPLGCGHSHRRQSLQAIQLPQLSTIPTHTPVFAGAEGVEGRSPSLNLDPRDLQDKTLAYVPQSSILISHLLEPQANRKRISSFSPTLKGMEGMDAPILELLTSSPILMARIILDLPGSYL